MKKVQSSILNQVQDDIKVQSCDAQGFALDCRVAALLAMTRVVISTVAEKSASNFIAVGMSSLHALRLVEMTREVLRVYPPPAGDKGGGFFDLFLNNHFSFSRPLLRMFCGFKNIFPPPTPASGGHLRSASFSGILILLSLMHQSNNQSREACGLAGFSSVNLEGFENLQGLGAATFAETQDRLFPSLRRFFPRGGRFSPTLQGFQTLEGLTTKNKKLTTKN